MDDLPASYVAYVEKLHALHDYELNFRLLSESLGVRIKPGLENSFVPGPTPTIVLEPHLYGWSHSRVGLHELGHLFIRWSGIEAQLLSECSDKNYALQAMENLAHLTVAVLQIPTPLLEEALQRHGDSPAAILYMAKRSGASLGSALRRWVFQDAREPRFAFSTAGSYILDTAAFGTLIPIYRGARIPEPAIEFPEISLRTFKPGRSVGVFVGR
ncbi:ImmA/IrrE family metallo-endopeptidase [Deinococcus peraridilitoris]|uniref:Zn peptidase n=1 Tax=Deinococcus peraridilitoris (strain DSM 19664 / LMG 22246 / CIP 109416 / KR-200) TaxID=937777 RepID=L0A0P2_DEIPD|nr:hypothetical protein [Deinococcus peraridilitoris]AFZ67024.1 hypothetical protein Deipe_1483 [Deinococcus peraridilitoris DSM 19664]